ncbi:MAG: hypothetical protein KAT05_13910 [Spirochaetes bacterium]|nr:hypothetical protein [Spirochaetota bacterium]
MIHPTMPFLTRKKLRILLEDSCFFPSKEQGQNYLVDERICQRIIQELDLKPTDQILEIGAGFGAFTDEIVTQTKRTYIFEKDTTSAKFLTQYYKPQYVTVHLKPKSQISWDRILPDTRIIIFRSDALHIPFPPANKLVSNVPYSIVFPLIMKIIHSWTYDQVVLIIQKEVADRLIATSGMPGYNVLAAFTGFYTKSMIIQSIPKLSFYPKPEVESVIVKILPRPTISSQASERQLRSEFELFLRGLFREMTWSLKQAITEMQKKKVHIFQKFPFLLENMRQSQWSETPVRNIPTELLFQLMRASLPRKYHL